MDEYYRVAHEVGSRAKSLDGDDEFIAWEFISKAAPQYQSLYTNLRNRVIMQQPKTIHEAYQLMYDLLVEARAAVVPRRIISSWRLT